MTDSLNNNYGKDYLSKIEDSFKNVDNKETFGISSSNAGNLGSAATLANTASKFKFLRNIKGLGPISSGLNWVSLLLEINEDGPVKGTYSWGASTVAGLIGFARGLTQGPKCAWNQGLSDANKADAWTDNWYDKASHNTYNPLKTMWGLDQQGMPINPIGNINNSQPKPLQSKGFLNDKNPTQQSFLEQNGLPDMQKQYAHLMNDRTSLNNVYGDRFKAMQDAANQGGNVTGISNSATAARAWINPNPSPMTFLNPEFEDLLSQGYDATSTVNNLLNDNSSSLSDAEAGMINAKNAYFASLYDDDDDSGFWGSWFGRILGRIINKVIDNIINNYINNTISGFLTEHLGPGGQIISPIAEDYVDTKIKDVTSVIHIHT